MSLQTFPMDEQDCELKIETFGFTTDDLHLRWEDTDNPVQINDDLELPEFKLSKHTVHNCTLEYVTGEFCYRFRVR